MVENKLIEIAVWWLCPFSGYFKRFKTTHLSGFSENIPWNHFEHFHFDKVSLSKSFQSTANQMLSFRLDENSFYWKLDCRFVTILISNIRQGDKFSTAKFVFWIFKIDFNLQFWLVNKQCVPNRYISRHFYPFISKRIKIFFFEKLRFNFLSIQSYFQTF